MSVPLRTEVQEKEPEADTYKVTHSQLLAHGYQKVESDILPSQGSLRDGIYGPMLALLVSGS